MKKRILLKIKLLPHSEYKKLARILKIRFGLNLDTTRNILQALEEECKKIDPQFNYTTEYSFLSPTVVGSYDPDTHVIYISPETYDKAYQGDVFALYTIVHEISHWALLTVFHVKPEFVILELPLAHASTTDAEFYADMLSFYLMMPSSVFSGKKNIKSLLIKGKKRGIYNMSLIILNNRRYCRAIGFKHPAGFSTAKKTA